MKINYIKLRIIQNQLNKNFYRKRYRIFKNIKENLKGSNEKM